MHQVWVLESFSNRLRPNLYPTFGSTPQVDPEHFDVFDKAFITLFSVTGGDPWPDTLPKARFIASEHFRFLL